ncbi:MAG: HAD family hydrolase [Pseudomonadota bacterium]
MTGRFTGLTVAFDLDGTLIDTAPDLIATAQAVIAKRGLGPVPEDVIQPLISFGSRRMLEAAFAHHGVITTSAEIDRLFTAFLQHYRDNIAVHSQPYPKLRNVLEHLKREGAAIAVCTNKLESPSRLLLDALNLTSAFAFIAGRDTFPVHKPDPGHLIGAIEQAGGIRTQAVMVGDSDVDVSTAKAAGVPVIGVTFGYTPVSVRELGCDAVIDHYDEFMPIIDQIAQRMLHDSGSEPR